MYKCVYATDIIRLLAVVGYLVYFGYLDADKNCKIRFHKTGDG